MRTGWISPLFLLLALLVPCAGCVVNSDGVHFLSGGSERAERVDVLALELSAGEALDVELVYGDITVEVEAGATPHVEARWSASAKDKTTAESVLARYQLELVRGAASLRVRPVGEPLEIKGSLGTSRLSASVDLTLVVPEGVRLTARSSSGDLEASGPLGSCRLESSYGDLAASGVNGDTRLVTSSGDVRVDEIQGSVVEARSQYGDIEASDIRAEKVQLATSSGDVEARAVAGEVTIRSTYGDLDIEDSTGALDAATSSGDIALESQGKASRKLLTSYGDIHVRGAVGELAAKTSSGDVEVEGADGVVRAESVYGDVMVHGHLTRVDATTSSGQVDVRVQPESVADGSWRIGSTYGDVKLSLPAHFDCALEATTKSGEVQCDGVRSEDGKPLRTIARTLGKGGASIRMTTASGDVVIAADQSIPSAFKRL